MQAIVHKRSVTDLEKRWRPVLFPLELTLSGSAKPRVAPDKDTVETLAKLPGWGKVSPAGWGRAIPVFIHSGVRQMLKVETRLQKGVQYCVKR